MSDQGVFVKNAGRVARVILDRPPVNAVSTGVYETLIEILEDLNSRTDISVVVLESANPKVFSAGADLQEMKAIVNSETDALDGRRQELARRTYELLLGLTHPTIAAVGGVALGAGAVLAACCDIRVGSVSTRIGVTEINVGRCGGGRHMMRILPQGVVRQMYFTAEPLGAEDLYRLGAIDQLRESGSEVEAALELADRIASKSPLALRIAKSSLNGCEPLSIDEGYKIEQAHTLQIGRSTDAKEAVAAFLEKRAPVWIGA